MERSCHLLTIRSYCCCSRGYLLRPRECLLFCLFFAIGQSIDYLITLGPLKDFNKSQVKFYKKRYSYINIYIQECLTRIFLINNFVSYKQKAACILTSGGYKGSDYWRESFFSAMYIPHERKRLIAYIFVLIMSFSMSKSHLIIDIIANL